MSPLETLIQALEFLHAKELVQNRNAPSRLAARKTDLKPITKDRELKAIRLYTENNYSLQQAGLAIGISTQSVYNILKKYHIPIRSKSQAKRTTIIYEKISP